MRARVRISEARHLPGLRRLQARLLAVLFLACSAHVHPAAALKFEPVAADQLPMGVGSALWARDCGLVRGEECAEGEDGFSTGDAAKLERYLRAGRYDEIWFASGGGNLVEGIEIGHLLRRYQQTTRVPSGRSCVSACTVAFLGGVFRFVDETAHYEMHAASVFLRMSVDSDAIRDLVEDPERELTSRWQDAIGLAREIAVQMLPHLQAAVHPLGRMPGGQEQRTRAELASWASTFSPADYGAGAQLRDDAARIRREGPAAAQDVLMRLERDAIALATESLRARSPQLGSRAESALAIFSVMYSSRITNTAELSQQTMRQLGIVTVLFDPGAR